MKKIIGYTILTIITILTILTIISLAAITPSIYMLIFDTKLFFQICGCAAILGLIIYGCTKLIED